MKKIVNNEEAINLISGLAEEFSVIKNPDYIHPEFEIVPLAKKNCEGVRHLTAILMDMDGTTTTTEELCIHSLEFAIRKITNRMTSKEWVGLDHSTDYPHIIGNSTTKHVEYLINKYYSEILEEDAQKSFVYGALTTLLLGKDEQRISDVLNTVTNVGIGDILIDPDFLKLKNERGYNYSNSVNICNNFYMKYKESFIKFGFNEYVRVAIDIYYQRYHQILERIKAGESKQISLELFNDINKKLIEPMPGVEIFLPLIKGWLGPDIKYLIDDLLIQYKIKSGEEFKVQDKDNLTQKLIELSNTFVNDPLKVAIVTSSIFYEADIVISEVFSVIANRIMEMNLPDERKKLLSEKFRYYNEYYQGVISASDSNEIRLKPHRDLYSIALRHIGVPKSHFGEVIGFEDSESGTLAIRAAGIGLCVAVPFAQTYGHNFEAASVICKGGLPETLLKHNLFLMNQ